LSTFRRGWLKVKNMRQKLMLAAALGIGSVSLFGAAALGAFGTNASSNPVSAVAPAAPAMLGEQKAGDKLKDLLDGLVQKGVITQPQEDAILTAAKEKASKHMHGGKVVRGLLGESAKYLGLAPKDLFAKLPGTSLGKIADATPNKNKVGLVTALTAAANEDITKALSEKKITEDQAKKLRDGLAAKINTFVDRTWPTRSAVKPHPAGTHVRAVLGDMLQTARDYLGGMTREEVMTAMRSGKSLGEIANDKGRGRDNLVAALTLAANTRIDKAVADKQLTAEQATTLKSKVAAEIATFVDRKHPAKATTANGTTTKKP
jgi:polyhydroxyalkanoate synthesis regulator phasin